MADEDTKIVSYTLGAGPHLATRFEQPGHVEIHYGQVVGHGDTARDAAVHLAEQLRTIARFVEGHEGVRGET